MRLTYTLAFLLILSIANAQQTSQTIRGIVTDRDSKKVLPGATVTVLDIDRSISTMTDSAGHFVLIQVPTGRIRLRCTYTGYNDYVSDNILLNVAKEPELTLELEEQAKLQELVVVRTTRNPKLPVNRYALLSGRSFTPEETQRYAASANDPSRMALGFAGVQATRDTRSDIIIRGNNPVGMQWRLEGMDVVNPNHFARKGSTGGGITILSLSMLDNSDFLTGGMPAEYGDVLSGVFDMHFRKGNDQKRENTIKAGMIGLDYSTEGPLNKGSSSYLVNYRYSTLGLLHALGLNLVGERESNTFQDLAFNLAFGNKNSKSQWNIWGMGGYSKETYAAVKDTLDWKQYDDYAIYDFRTRMGATGISHTFRISDNSYTRSSVMLMAQKVTYVDDTVTKLRVPSTVNNEDYLNKRIAFTSSYNHKFSPVVNLKTGITVTDMFYNFRRDKMNYTNKNFENLVNGKGSSWLLQPYLQFSFKPGNWTINPGVHTVYLTLNSKASVDPRISIQYKLNQRQSASFAYGIYSKVLPLGSYFYTNDGGTTYPNHTLDMMRSHHYILGFDQLIGSGWRLHTEAYYQKLDHVPVVDSTARTFWLLNELDGYAKEPLVSKGTGENKGIDFTVEKYFSKGVFMIANYTIYNSTFSALDGKVYNTRFNSNSAGSFTGAKEWNWKKNKVFQLGWKMIYNGGFYLSALRTDIPSSSREPEYDERNPFSEKVTPYFRTDARFALRKDKAQHSWQLAIDVQNVLGMKNQDAMFRRYDPSVNRWVYDTQSGIVPVLSYQIDF